MGKPGDKLSRLLSKDNSCIVLLHNTPSLQKAKNIMREGFRYESQLTYSTDRVNPEDTVEIARDGSRRVEIALPETSHA